MKTSELTGALLDQWVARAMGGEYKLYRFADDGKPPNDMAWVFPDGCHIRAATAFNPSSNWSQGGPIIERMRIKLMPTIPAAEAWHATKCSSANLADMIVWRGKADTPLVAAMRCYVSEKFGDEVPDA